MKIQHKFTVIVLFIFFLVGCSNNDLVTNVGELEFKNPLKIPELAEPTIEADGTKHFDLTMAQGQTEFFSGVMTDTAGINGTYLGPTVRVERGDKVSFDVNNDLGEPSTLHWHGMMLPPEMDGGGHQIIEDGETWSPHWTIDQPAATNWYHPHLHGNTGPHVYWGLSGLFLIEDEDSDKLPHEYGVDDIPLIVQDKDFTEDGQMTMEYEGVHGVMGDEILINGTHDPYFEVTTQKVRFRVLNGSNTRAYNFGFTDDRLFDIVGNDVGLLNEPITLDRVMLSPGERAEIVVHFEPGEEVIFRSFNGNVGIGSGEFDLVKMVAAPELEESEALPREISSVPPIEEPENPTIRHFTLTGDNDINGKKMDMSRIDEVVGAGTTEVWEINNMGPEHNFHVHTAAFRVVEVNGDPPNEYESGRKDTVFVPSGASVKIVIEFADYQDLHNPLMYHCHILLHEDSGMMGQFLLVEPGTEDEVPLELEGDFEDHAH
ncbi:multicopper oxidase family protein [Oceanobacillus sp. CAU 1775]